MPDYLKASRLSSDASNTLDLEFYASASPAGVCGRSRVISGASDAEISSLIADLNAATEPVRRKWAAFFAEKAKECLN